jgi:hypothetical protein
MIDNKSIQRALAAKALYLGSIDGVLGQATRFAISRAIPQSWPYERKKIAFQQRMMADAGIDIGEVDGLWGPRSQYGLELWQNHLREVPGVASSNRKWPTQADVPKVFGPTGSGQVRYKPPYQLYLYDKVSAVESISVHEKVVDSLHKVMSKVQAEYKDLIPPLHLDRFFGSLNVRPMRGGKAMSMHSWGIAIDFDANRNQLRWGRDRAEFAKPEYKAWWDIWEEEQWTSLGRERNYDWMHVQAADL